MYNMMCEHAVQKTWGTHNFGQSRAEVYFCNTHHTGETKRNNLLNTKINKSFQPEIITVNEGLQIQASFAEKEWNSQNAN